MSDETQVEQTPVVQRKYKIYVVDNTSRMHTIRIGNGVILSYNYEAQLITHENALDFHDVFIKILADYDLFSFKGDQYSMIYKTKDLIGIQIVPEEY